MAHKYDLKAVMLAANNAGFESRYINQCVVEVIGKDDSGQAKTVIVWNADTALLQSILPEDARRALAAHDAIVELLKVDLPKSWCEQPLGLGRLFLPAAVDHPEDAGVVVTLRHNAAPKSVASLLHELADWLETQ